MADDNGKYKEFRFPKHRELLGTLAGLGPKHPIEVLTEFDVSKARACIRKHKEKTGETLSFTAWLITCIAQAVSEYKQVQAYRKGRRLIVFDDVDVGFTMERESKNGGMVAGAIVRQANEKTVRQIHEEIRASQTEDVTHGPIVGEEKEAKFAGFIQSMPGILRRVAVWRYRRDPFLRKKTQGTVGITSVGTILGESAGMLAFPIVSGPYPLFFGVSGTTKKPGIGDNRIEVRDYLPMSVMLDHDAVDGAEAARFLSRLGELLKTAYGLEIIEPVSD